MENDLYPDFIGIGASRNGTTWLHDALSEHPEIKMPSESKEPHYFSWNHSKGLAWYAKNFIKGNSEQITGEISTHYYHDLEAMRRIYQACPDAKLLLVCREQSDWMLSFFMFEGNEYSPDNFRAYLKNNTQLWTMGDYAKHIENILNLGFDKNKFHITFYDDLKRDNSAYFRGICNFIGVNPDFVPSNIGIKKNTVLFPLVRKMLKRAGMLWLKDLIKRSPLGNYLRSRAAGSSGRSYTELPDDIQSGITDAFRQSNLKLGALTGRADIPWIN